MTKTLIIVFGYVEMKGDIMNQYNYLTKLVRESSKGLKFIFAVVLGLIFTIAIGNMDSLNDFQTGTTTFDLYSMEEAAIDSSTYYEIDINDDFFYFESAMYEGDDIDTFYMGAFLGEKIVVIELPVDLELEGSTLVQGHFNYISSDVKEALEAELLEYDLDETIEIVNYSFKAEVEPPNQLLFIMGIIFAILVLVAIVVFINILKTRKLTTSKLYKEMGKLGDADTIADNIEREFEMKTNISQGPVHILSDHILVATSSLATIIEKDDLIWCYPKKIKTKKLFVTVNTRYEIFMETLSGKTVIAATSESEYRTVMSLLEKHHHRCVYGYSNEVKRIFRRSREEFMKEFFVAETEAIG